MPRSPAELGYAPRQSASGGAGLLVAKAYAHDLKDFLVFLARRDVDWREVRLEDLGEYVAWLALPPAGRDGLVAVLPSAESYVGAATVNRKLAALAAFYAHQARHGADVGELLTTWQVGGRRNGGFRPFLHYVSAGKPQARRTIALKPPKKLPRVVTAAEMQAILDACEHLRDRLLLAILWDAGVRVGEALGLRHEDIAVAEREVTIVPRANGNGARSKGRDPRTIPVRAQVIRLYGDYLATEYGDLDSDYVFVNLFAGPRGQAWTYAAVYDLVLRLRERTGLDFDPHWCRHAFATRSLRDGVPVEVVSRLLGHSSITTTVSVTSDRGGRSQRAGGRRLVHRYGGDLVTDILRITQADRAWWQQRAAAELGSILHQNPDLPCIGWTVGPAGSVLAGHVSGLAPAAQVRAVFDSWCHALVLEDYREHRGGGGTAFLHAAARWNQVKIRLSATVFGDEPETGQ